MARSLEDEAHERVIGCELRSDGVEHSNPRYEIFYNDEFLLPAFHNPNLSTGKRRGFFSTVYGLELMEPMGCVSSAT